MKLQVLGIEGCPNTNDAAAAARHALDSIGRNDVAVETVLITSADHAARVGFAGSPTFAIDGADLFPSDGNTTELACRVYITEQGMAGAPTQTQIAAALRSHPAFRAA